MLIKIGKAKKNLNICTDFDFGQFFTTLSILSYIFTFGTKKIIALKVNFVFIKS